MSKLHKFFSAAWRDSRPAVYAFLFAFATGTYSFVHAHGFPKTHTDWTVLLWSLGGIAFSAFVRAVDPYIAKMIAAGAKVAFAGGMVVNQDDIAKIVQAELDAMQKRIEAERVAAEQAQKAGVSAPPPPPSPTPPTPGV